MHEKELISVLEIVDIATGERTVVDEFKDKIEAPNWKSNGKELIFNGSGNLYGYHLETKTRTLLETGFCNDCNNDHVLSPDNTEIAISHNNAAEGSYNSLIYRIPIDGGAPKQVTKNGPSFLHGWSPDGQTLAFCGFREINGKMCMDVYTIPAGGGEEIRLTTAEGLNDGPEYSPDGKYIWFNSVRSGLMQIWRMKPDGSEQTQMTFDESNNWFPHISPDGKQVAYLAYRKEDLNPGEHLGNLNVEIRLMSSEGGASRTLAKLFGGQGTLNVNSWSPDSKQLAFMSYH